MALAGDDASESAARSASVTFASRQVAAAAGVEGVVFTVSRADGGSVPSPARVTLNYSSFASAYGGGYADRLRLVEMPGCALTTPQLAECRVQTPVAYTNDQQTGTLSATLAIGGAGSATQSPARSTHATQGNATVLAATSSASGSVGNYSATSLSQAGSWTAGGSSGAFTYSYPIALPPTVGGSAPSVALSYDSASVDGRTSATNAQASWIGDGWDYSPGYVERSYQPCSQDGIVHSSDECWAGNVVTLSLNGQNEQLVDSSGTWKLQDDDGAKVTPLTGQSNGAFAGEGWQIVEPDGTQYYFGANPDSLSAAPASASTWTEPVYCPKSGDGPSGNTCYSAASGANSFQAAMAWRWNLDYVIDPHGNLITYTWAPETNYYKRGYDGGANAGTNTVYTRGGHLNSISYGYRVSDAVAGTKPLDTVTFGVGGRCTPGTSNCTYSYLSTNLSNSAVTSNWPDTPADQICPTSGSTCSDYAPSFFSTYELQTITTAVLVGTSYDNVDTYALSQYFPDPQAGVVVDPTKSYDSPGNPGDGTVAVMWLGSIARTGDDTLGGGTASTPLTTAFTPDLMPNRVDGTTTGYAALYRPRMDEITTPSGEQIVVSYSTPDCSSTNHPTPGTNTTNCFPQYWSPVGGPILDWFNTYQVIEVTQNDLVGPTAWSEAQVTQYAYKTAAWHRDDSPITPNSQRTWNGFRGFQKVTTTVGASSAESTPTQSVSIYMQGMNGDYLADGTQRSACVNDNVGDCVTDAPQLQGDALETDTLNGSGGTVEKREVNGPWAYTQTGSETQTSVGTPTTTLPALTAQMLASDQTRSYQLWHDGTWKTLTTDETYDTHGRLVTSDAKGDGTSAVPEVCTTTSYAGSTSSNPNMLAYPDEVKSVKGACGTALTSSTAVSDKLAFYDSSATLGTLTGPGDVTETEQATSYSDSGTPTYVIESKAGYDVYGRVTSATDADGNTTTTSYTAPAASPDVVTTTNPMTWSSSTTLDPARGSTLASTDVNGELTSYTYDGLGRVTAVWSPLHAKASGAPADQTYAYSETGTAASTVSTNKLLDDGQYATSVAIYDGNLRQIQTQAPTVNGALGRLVTDTHYNSLGQTAKTSSTYFNADVNAPSTTPFVAANDTYIPAETETSYDGLGRSTEIETVAFGVNQYATTTAYPGMDQTDVTPPAGGTATSTFTDAAGREIASWKYTTAGPTDKASDATATSYTYTPASQQATIADDAGDQWSFTYNLLGQRTAATDPGTGTSSTTYSAGGEVLTTTDANGITLTYSYDKLARKTAEYNTTGGLKPGATNEIAAWTYDTLEKGQPTSVITYTNPTQGANDPANTYTETESGYTALYQSTGESVTIPSSQGALANTYQSTNVYTTGISLLLSVRYGAYAGLPREGVNLGRNSLGVIDGYSGVASYLNLAQYNPLGQILQTNFGPSGAQMDRTETYDPATGRLLTRSDQIQLQGPASTLDDTTYTYDQAGRVTAESDTQYGVSAPDTQCFTYNNLGELTTAFTSTDPVTSTAGSTSAQIQGTGACNDTAPVAGKVTGGPAPYWQSYSYDLLGDRVQEVNHDTSVTSNANNVTQTLTYTGYNPATGATVAAATPDAVQSTSTTGPTGTATSNYQYFANGAVKSRSGQSFTYNPAGQTASVTNTGTGTTSTYTYDATGALLLQNDPANNQTILYLPWGEQLTLNTGNGTVAGLRYYTESPDGLVVVRSSNGTITYEGDSPQGTATVQVNAATLAYTFRYYDPYGNLRGTAPTSWPDQHSYLGKPQDPATGLDLLGAREYDPATGRFLSVDPVLESGDQRQMNGYSYGADDPVNSSDPSGLWIAGDGSGTQCDSHGDCRGNAADSGPSPCQSNPNTPGCGGGSTAPTASAPPDLQISPHVLLHANNPAVAYLKAAWQYAVNTWGAVHNTFDEAQRWRQLCTLTQDVCTGDLLGLFGASAGINYILGDAGAVNPFAKLGTLLLTGNTGPGQGYARVSALGDEASLEGVSTSDLEQLVGSDAESGWLSAAATVSEPVAGQTLYRVYGGDSKAGGASWSPVDPRTVPNYRDAAGLPSGGASGATNTGQFVIEGTLNDASAVVLQRNALPLDGMKGGITEYIIPQWMENGSITVDGVYGVNPEF